jgi:hypothetical protein
VPPRCLLHWRPAATVESRVRAEPEVGFQPPRSVYHRHEPDLYVGADLDAVITALISPDPSDDFPALLTAVATVQLTAYPLRAEVIADEVAKAHPHVIGLQEVSQIDVDLTPVGVPAVIHQDFLAILQAALAARGLN